MGRDRRAHRKTSADTCVAASASARSSSPSPRRADAASTGCSTTSSTSSTVTSLASRPPKLKHVHPGAPQPSRGAPDAGAKRLNLLYGTQTQSAPAAPPHFRQRPVARPRATTRFWSRNEIRERFGLEGVPRPRSTLPSGREVSRRRRRIVGAPSSRACCSTAGTTSWLRLPHGKRQAQAIAETGRNPRYFERVDLRGARTVHRRGMRRGDVERCGRPRCRARRSPRSVAGLPGNAARAQPHEGPSDPRDGRAPSRRLCMAARSRCFSGSRTLQARSQSACRPPA